MMARIVINVERPDEISTSKNIGKRTNYLSNAWKMKKLNSEQIFARHIQVS